MSLAVGLNHATVTTPILYAASVLTSSNGNASNAVLYITTLICSLFFSNLLYARLGSKNGLALSMLLYTCYVALFAVSAQMCVQMSDSGTCLKATPSQGMLACLGAFIGGIGAGLLWTCQGAFYSLICEKLALAEDRQKEEVTGEFAGIFAFIYLGTECSVRACTTLLTGASYANLTYATTFFIWAFVAFLSVAFFQLVAINIEAASEAKAGSVCDKLLTAVRLWRDPKLWLLQTTNITFGFGAAWLAGYVGPNILSVALKSSFIGFAGAILSGLAAVLSWVLAPLAGRLGKGPVLALGSLAFFSIGIFSKWIGNPSTWGWGATVFYIFMGIGRAVYESTNKAIIADFFPGDQSPGAFANVFVFGNAASSIAFMLAASQNTSVELYLLLIFAALTVPSFIAASHLRAADGAEEEKTR